MSRAGDGLALPTRQFPRENQLLYRDVKGSIRTATTVAEWQRRKRATLEAMAAIFGPFPGEAKRCDLQMEIGTEEDLGSYMRRRITFQSEPGCRTPAYLLIPKSALKSKEEPTPAVLCLQQTNLSGADEVVGISGNPELMYGKELAQRGYVVIAPCYPTFGNYHPDLKGLGWESGSLKAVWDNIRCLDLLDSLPYVRHGHYAVIGHSLGGHNAVYTSVFDDRIGLVISCCGLDGYLDFHGGEPANWLPERGWVQSRYLPKLGSYQGRLTEIPFDFHEIVAGLAPRTVLIIAPQEDSNFRAESVDRIAAAAQPVFALHGVPGHLKVEHPPGGHQFPQEMRLRSYLLIDSLLQLSASPPSLPLAK
ncbi:dienelactone hydrolase family protein [Planctomicrobium sp. SH664]|uniref:dienelactone hydrolase family protein n=1 Tax=Planctomicrobium sp. SH664 TaxID=3448125 RepID=UPI003F5C7784